jgi:hypothetical protein
MPRNAERRRRKAVFLCLQFGLVACFVVIMAMVYLAWPIPQAHAQAMCVPAERFAQTLSEQPTVERVTLLGRERTGLYLEAVTGREANPEANVILFIAEGQAAIVPVVNGQACAEYGVIQIGAQQHEAGMMAVYGRAI